MFKYKYYTMVMMYALSLFYHCCAYGQLEVNDNLGLRLYLVQQKDQFGYIDNGGQLRIEWKLGSGYTFQHGLARFVQDGKWGYIDTNGDEVIPAKYFKALPFFGNTAFTQPSRDESIIHIIDRHGKILNRLEGLCLLGATGPYAVVSKNTPTGLAGIVDSKGNWRIEPKYYHLYFIGDNTVAYVQTGDPTQRMGIMLISGQILVPPKFRNIGKYSNGIAPATEGRFKWGYIDTAGQYVIKPRFDDTNTFQEQLGRVRISYEKQYESGTRAGFINDRGEWIIEPKYEKAENFSEGLAAVRFMSEPDKWKWGYINHSGDLIIDAIYDYAGPFQGGIAEVSKDSAQAYINNHGEIIWRSDGVSNNVGQDKKDSNEPEFDRAVPEAAQNVKPPPSRSED